MKHETSGFISSVGLLCLIVGLGAMFFSWNIGLTLIGTYLVVWLFLNFPLGRKGLEEAVVDESVSSPIEIIGSEIDRTSEDFIPRSLAGVRLGTSVEELEKNHNWKELTEEEKKPLELGADFEERIFGSLKMNLIAGIRKNTIWKISFAHIRDKRLEKLVSKIHARYGTAEDNLEEWILWEDDHTRLDYLPKGNKGNLTLTAKYRVDEKYGENHDR